MWILDFLNTKYRTRIRKREKIRANRNARKSLRQYMKSLNDREYELSQRAKEIEERSKSINTKLDYIDSLIAETKEAYHRIDTVMRAMTRLYQSANASMNQVKAVERNVSKLRIASQSFKGE